MPSLICDLGGVSLLWQQNTDWPSNCPKTFSFIQNYASHHNGFHNKAFSWPWLIVFTQTHTRTWFLVYINVLICLFLWSTYFITYIHWYCIALSTMYYVHKHILTEMNSHQLNSYTVFSSEYILQILKQE